MKEKIMIDPVEPLILDLLEWVSGGERSYAEVMEAWRTSCPRLPIWEEANERGLIQCERAADGRTCVRLTPAGSEWLSKQRAPSLR